MHSREPPMCVELCAGAGGMALGMERAGWRHTMLVERDVDAALTMKRNNPHWPVVCADIAHVDARRITPCDLVCGGPPCQPFSAAGRKMGDTDPRDIFMPALRLAISLLPKIILLENVLGLTYAKHAPYRAALGRLAADAGYATRWIRIDCSMWGVPQHRKRVIFAAARVPPLVGWPPLPPAVPHPSLHDTLISSGMPSSMVPPQLDGRTCPTITNGGPGGARTHGVGKGSLDNGAHSSRDWAELGIHSGSISDGPEAVAPTTLGRGGGGGHGACNGRPQCRNDCVKPGVDARPVLSERLAPTIMAGHSTCARSNKTVDTYHSMGLDPRCAESGEPHKWLVRLSMRNVAAIQGFPPEYEFVGSKRSVYQQIGNALPPPAAEQLGRWAMRLAERAV